MLVQPAPMQPASVIWTLMSWKEGRGRRCTLKEAQQAHADLPLYPHPQHAQSGWPAMPATHHLAGALAWTAAGAL